VIGFGAVGGGGRRRIATTLPKCSRKRARESRIRPGLVDQLLDQGADCHPPFGHGGLDPGAPLVVETNAENGGLGACDALTVQLVF
jgi:hypothetical protein